MARTGARGPERCDDEVGDLCGVDLASAVAFLSEISRIERGDFLVTVATDPGWTTVFSIVGGVVVETGGVVAHAVTISREYGLPCVANLPRACEQIPDGATITVDGTTGRVPVHAQGERSPHDLVSSDLVANDLDEGE